MFEEYPWARDRRRPKHVPSPLVQPLRNVRLECKQLFHAVLMHYIQVPIVGIAGERRQSSAMQLLVEVPLSIQSVTEMFTPNCIWRLLRTLAQIRRSYTYTHATLRLYIDLEEVRTGVWGILRSWLALHPKSQCHPWMQIKPWPFQRMFGFFLKLQPSLISTASGISIRSLLKDRRFFIIWISGHFFRVSIFHNTKPTLKNDKKCVSMFFSTISQWPMWLPATSSYHSYFYPLRSLPPAQSPASSGPRPPDSATTWPAGQGMPDGDDNWKVLMTTTKRFAHCETQFFYVFFDHKLI